MRPPTTPTALLALFTTASAIAVPLSSRAQSNLKHPIAHLPLPSGFTLASTPLIPKITLLNKADLQTLGTVVSGSPGSRTSPAEKRDILGGTDNRFLQTKTGNPWDYIGRFEWPDATGINICTGSLVGPRHLVTARHCIDTVGNQLKGSYTFKPNYDQGARGYVAAKVTNVFYLPGTLGSGGECSYGDDWAVLVLDQRIGDRYGWFGVKQFGPGNVGKADFWHEGYPVDKANAERPYVQDKITARTTAPLCNSGATGPIYTDADVQGGQSGGPLWLLPEADGVRYLYGVCSSGDASKTLFAGRPQFVNAVAKARSDYP